jgi:diguanylate cyclase (GGDEF)-like protein
VQFDLFTLVAATVAAVLMLSALFGYFWLRERDAPWLVCWGSAFLVGACGSLVRFLAEDAADSFLMVASSAFLITAFGLAWQAARMFEGKRFSAWPTLIATAIWLASMAFPVFLQSLALRVVVASLITAVFLGLAARELWQGRAEPLMSRMPAVIVLASGACVFLLRAALVDVLPFPLGGLPTVPWAAAGMTFAIVFHAVCLTVLFVSLTRERMEGQQRRFAQTDALTGLLNRRAFAEEGARMVKRCRALHQPVGLLALDIDRFKSINDRFGHTAGDRVLEHFAIILRETLRSSDGVFRMGGEEFCCILPGADADQARNVADRICSMLGTRQVPTEAGRLDVTVSVGVSVVAEGEYDLEALLQRADAALYQAKAGGRNRAVFSADVVAAE